MKIRNAALALAGGTLMTTLVGLPTASPAAAAEPVGRCTPLTVFGYDRGLSLFATGTYKPTGGVVLSGTRIIARFGRDTRTHIVVSGTMPTANGPARWSRSFRDVGAARAYATPRNASAPKVSVLFDGTGGLRDHRCTFTAAR